MRPPQVPVAEVRGAPRPARAPAPRPDAPDPPERAPAEPDPAPPQPHVLCDVCCEHVPAHLLRGCAACAHRYCAPCVDKYWTGAIYSGNHARLLCMYGGCGVFATDADIAAVVSERTFRKMLYFRSRDRFNACPDARWCARDMCWEFLGRFTVHAMQDTVVSCNRCKARTCVKCERLVSDPATARPGERPVKHVCASRKPNKAHSALFGLWATLHTKSCPACAARIQRNHGCSHMTCTRCSSYFCWRCKGFLNNGCPLPGRACICDRVMTAAAYSGLAVATVIGSPVIVTAVLIGGGPYIAYRIIKSRRDRARPRLSPPLPGASNGAYAAGIGQHRGDAAMSTGGVVVGSARSARLGRTSGRVLQPDQMVVQDDDDFDSGSTGLTAFSEVMVAEARGLATARPGRRLTVHLQQYQRPVVESERSADGSSPSEPGKVFSSQGTPIELPKQMDRAILVISHEESESFGGSSRTFGSAASLQRNTGSGEGGAPTPVVDEDSLPSVNVDTCKTSRPFVLERRRGSVNGTRVVRRTVL